MIAARLLASRGKEELMHTPTIYMFDDPSAALSSAGEMVARARTVPERARRKAAPPAATELQLSAERLAERNASRLAWAVATALGFAVVIGSIVGFIVSILGMLLVPEFGHSLSAGTLASIVAIVAGSALVGGLIGARAALDGSGPPAAPKLDTAARTSTGSSRFEFSEGTSPPRHSHELL